jgi:transketolase
MQKKLRSSALCYIRPVTEFQSTASKFSGRTIINQFAEAYPKGRCLPDRGAGTMKERNELEKFAAEIRIAALESIGKCGFGHVGGSMSIADVLAVLYGDVMKYDAKNNRWEERDWLIVSKGHAGPAVYAALAIKGFFDREMLYTLNQPGTNLPSHCDANKTPGIDMTTGSLGQGLSLGAGVAIGNKMQGRDSYAYVIIGDGESQEGQVWEAVMFAAQSEIDNLILFVDNNKDQIDGYTKTINNVENFEDKFRAFNWDVRRVDGHDVIAIEKAVEKAKAEKGMPSAIVLDTVKGKGCSFCEGVRGNHHIQVTQEQISEAVQTLRSQYCV